MTQPKERLTVTVDADLIDAVREAVEAGRASSLSSWVTVAIRDKARRDERLELLAAAVADYEQEFGEITPEEVEQQRRSDRAAATVVRGRRRATPAR